jgi:Ca2+-transporting ATPase
VEPEEKGVMARKPRRARESILSGGIGFHIVWVGVLMVIGVLGLFSAFLPPASVTDPAERKAMLEYARTMAFLTLSLFQVFHVLAIRVWGSSVVRAGFFGNPYLLGAVAITVALQFAVIYVPALALAFGTKPLSLEHVLWSTAIASSVFFIVEVEKWIRRRRQGRSDTSDAEGIPEASA